jgi:leucine carboxyl methyltransferase
VGVELQGIPETALWTLYMRASEAERPDSVIDDPQAVALLERIDFPFEERFGPPRVGQWQALRARAFDDEIRRFLGAHPDGTVVALGEGLETGFWRSDNGRVSWLSVELPAMAALRRELLPQAPNLRLIERSALDEAWVGEVDPARGVLLTAQGLLMYFEPEQVHGLIDSTRRRFPRRRPDLRRDPALAGPAQPEGRAHGPDRLRAAALAVGHRLEGAPPAGRPPPARAAGPRPGRQRAAAAAALRAGDPLLDRRLRGRPSRPLAHYRICTSALSPTTKR